MIGWYEPSPPIRMVYSLTTATGEPTTVFWAETAPAIIWSHAAPSAPVTDFEKAIAELRAHAARALLRTRLALAEQSRIARRCRSRAPSGQPTQAGPARRTCSLSSRWMVLQ